VYQLLEPSVIYTVPLDHFIGTTVSSITPSIGLNMQSVGQSFTILLQKTQSTMVPHIVTIPTSNIVVSQAPIGTPLPSRPTQSLPPGYRAINPSIVNTTQVILGSTIPIQQLRGIDLGGYNLLSGIGQSSMSGFQILGASSHAGGQPPHKGKPLYRGKPLFGRKPPLRGKPPFGGQPHAGGKPHIGSHHQPSGQNVSTTRNPWNVPFPGNPLFSGGYNPQSIQHPPLSQGTYPYPPYGKNVYRPYGKTSNPTYNPENPFGYPPLANVSQTPSNPVYSRQQKPYAGGPTSYNYPLTQCMVLLVFLCLTSITRRLIDNYLSLLLWISQTCLG
jgi:hypothetical protein